MSWVAYPITAFIMIAATALQNTWPGWALVLGRGPNLALAAVVAVAISAGPVLGCFSGLIAGLLVASTQSAPLGTHLLIGMVAGTVVGLMRGTLLAERPLVSMMVMLVAAPLADMTRMLLAPPEQVSPWLLGSVLAAPYSALAAGPVYLFVRLLTDRVYKEI